MIHKLFNEKAFHIHIPFSCIFLKIVVIDRLWLNIAVKSLLSFLGLLFYCCLILGISEVYIDFLYADFWRSCIVWPLVHFKRWRLQHIDFVLFLDSFSFGRLWLFFHKYTFLWFLWFLWFFGFYWLLWFYRFYRFYWFYLLLKLFRLLRNRFLMFFIVNFLLLRIFIMFLNLRFLRFLRFLCIFKFRRNLSQIQIFFSSFFNILLNPIYLSLLHFNNFRARFCKD